MVVKKQGQDSQIVSYSHGTSSGRVQDIRQIQFQNVPNVGGKALCQEDFNTFQIMRASQAASWSEATLESYLDDLKVAEGANRNLLTEKYARMMQSKWPSEYARIEHLLPHRLEPIS